MCRRTSPCLMAGFHPLRALGRAVNCPHVAACFVCVGVGCPPPNDRSTFEGVEFGPLLTLTCTWFTNFENSRFEQCRSAGKEAFPADGGASIKCLNRTCDELDAEARKVEHWTKPDPPWGSFTVQLEGRVSRYQHKSRFIGDGASTVLIEKLLSVRPANVAR